MATKKEEVKELERQERVNETVSKTDQFFRENKKTIYGVLIALLVIGLAIVGYYKLSYQPKAKEAARQMYPAEASFRSGEYDLALNGDGNVLGFSQILEDYGAKGGKDIYLYAGLCEYNLGNYQQAVDYLKSYKGKEPLMKARCLAGIADAYTGLEDYNEALNYYQKALAVTENLNEDFVNVFNATYMLKAGVACEEIGDKAKALEFYKTIKDRYPQSIEGYDIDKYISRIESQQ
jgi:tetratricopeptide (TPR) repeat protein